MQRFTFRIDISAEDWLDYYGGRVKYVVATADDGRTVKFAAKHLQSYIRRDGVHGRFRMLIDDQNNFVRLEAVSS